MNNKRVTIYDLAKAINLSPSYISKALNNHPSVGDKMKEKVRKAAKDLNYKHNSYAANLRMGISKTIGVIVPHISWYPSVRISSRYSVSLVVSDLKKEHSTAHQMFSCYFNKSAVKM